MINTTTTTTTTTTTSTTMSDNNNSGNSGTSDSSTLHESSAIKPPLPSLTSYIPFTFGVEALYDNDNNNSSSSSSRDDSRGRHHRGCIKHGMIELYQMIPLETILKNGYPSFDESANDGIQMNGDNNNSLLCLLLAPSFMIPRDILHYFNTYVNSIVSVHILRHSSDMEKYLALMMMESPETAMNLIRDFNGELLTSLEPTTCMIHFVKEVHASNPLSLYNSPMKSIKGDLSGDHDKAGSKLDNFVRKTRSLSDLSMELSAIESLALDISSKQHKCGESPAPANGISLMRLSIEDQICPVCLEPISETMPQSFTTCCNHTFHILCIYKTEGPQCPCCRFQHDSTPVSLSQCVICSWSGEESERAINNRDLWICLVCGFIGCGSSNCFHIRDHYESLLHAYAMNVENGRVWDFAGDGYVHRLIMQQSDTDYSLGSLSEDGSISNGGLAVRVQPKMVEVPDPRYRQSSRTRLAPLTTDEESLVINRKLESTAYHYNQLLTWQLEQNRQQYEDRLHRFKDFLNQELQLASNKDSSKSWSQTVEELLIIEKSKALKKRDLALARLDDAKKELMLLQDFNKNLSNNLLELQSVIVTAEEKVDKAEKVYSDYIPKLEKKVQSLMEKL